MAKLMKKLLWTAAVAGVGYVAFKKYRAITSFNKLRKTLPEFLNNVYGEKPELKMGITCTLNKMVLNIKTTYSQEIIDENDDIEATISEYIKDFYPSLNKAKCNIELIVKNEEPETCEEKDTQEEGECCNCCNEDTDVEENNDDVEPEEIDDSEVETKEEK